MSPCLLLLLLLLALSPLTVQAQQKGGKKTKAAPTRRAAAPGLGGQQVCEGALEVIPRRELSFTRKRRPAAAQPTSDSPPSGPRKDGSSTP